jgi:hypothetical protein
MAGDDLVGPLPKGTALIDFVSKFAWNGIFRAALFWGLTFIALAALSYIVPYANWRYMLDVLSEVARGDIGHVADRAFAFGVASAIVQVAAALGFTFLICHVVLVRLALSIAEQDVERASDVTSFAEQFETISARLGRNGLIGRAWRAFAETTVRENDVVQNTIRPQSFINSADARERLSGLKMMPAIPGYFVGLGLLLTFIGLVLALYKATGATGTRSADEMAASLDGLLQAATFKFATSIAGLGSSLALSLVFRTYQIWIDAAFYRFCQALESRLAFHPSQRLAIETRDILAEQRDELKEINSDRFFSRLGETVRPGLEVAIGPLAAMLSAAMEKLEKASQSGLEEMLSRFLQELRGGAGVEMTAIADSLRTAREGLDGTKEMLAGPGADFARHLSEGSKVLSRVVEEAARTAEALGRVATDVQLASQPLLVHGERVAGAAESMAGSIGSSVAALAVTEEAARSVASALQAHFEQIASVWSSYEQRFRGADEDFGRAAERFHEEVSRHQDAMRNFVIAIDQHTADILAKINTAVAGLSESVENLNETLDELLPRLVKQSAVE